MISNGMPLNIQRVARTFYRQVGYLMVSVLRESIV